MDLLECCIFCKNKLDLSENEWEKRSNVVFCRCRQFSSLFSKVINEKSSGHSQAIRRLVFNFVRHICRLNEKQIVAMRISKFVDMRIVGGFALIKDFDKFSVEVMK